MPERRLQLASCAVKADIDAGNEVRRGFRRIVDGGAVKRSLQVLCTSNIMFEVHNK
jgi:hypothetical protein